MILGDSDRATGGNRTTLDDLFRRAGVRNADTIALADPPNREQFTDGAPRHLTYAQADRAISVLAARLRQFGLQTDTVVAMQLPNTVESVIALLAVLRAGMIAAPLPLLWRKQEIVAALGRIGAKAIVTSSRIGETAHAEVAIHVAAELFPIRAVCGFGRDLPDGVAPLDDVFDAGPAGFVAATARDGNAAAHAAVVTFDKTADGPCAVARNHMELIAGGLGPYSACGAPLDRSVLSSIPLGSFAGLSLTLLPWLLGGGTLSLHHAFEPEAFAAQARGHDDGVVVLPGPALRALTRANSGCRPAYVVALWRSPERRADTRPWRGGAMLVDVACFGETGLIAARRGDDGMPVAIPFGVVGAPQGAADAVPVLETMRSVAGMLALRGPMVPAQAFPPGAERGPAPFFAAHESGFVDTGYACRHDRDSHTLILSAPPAGIISIGGYRLRQAQVDAQVAAIDAAATIVALPDAALGQRLAGSAHDRAAVTAELQSRGVNPLIAGAFRGRNLRSSLTGY
jgi:hypothetical protein